MRISKLALGGTLVATILGGLMTFAVISGSPVGEPDIVHAAPAAPTIKAFALCSNGSISEGNPVAIPRGDGDFSVARCPGSLEVVSGGYRILGNTRGLMIIQNSPLANGDGSDLRWVVVAER